MENAPRADIGGIQVERSMIIFEGIGSLAIVGHSGPNTVIQQRILT